MGKIQANPIFLKRLLFLQRHSSKVLVTQNGVSSRHITIQSPGFSDCSFGIETKELVEMLKHTDTFELNEQSFVKYSYSSNIGEQDATVCRTLPVFNLKNSFDFKESICTIKLPIFKCISGDELLVSFLEGKLVLESNGYVKTRMVFDVNRVEGAELFSAKVKGIDLKIIEEIEGDRVLCYYENSLVVFGFDNDLSMAVVIRCIS